MRPDEGSRSRGTQGRTCKYPEWLSSRNPPHTQVRACPGETEVEATEGVSLARLLG